jgi:hypothetical protein
MSYYQPQEKACPSTCLHQIAFLIKRQKPTEQSLRSLTADAHRPLWKCNDHCAAFKTECRFPKDIRECAREVRHKSTPFMLLTSTRRGVEQKKKRKDMLENRKSLSKPLFFWIEFLCTHKGKVLSHTRVRWVVDSISNILSISRTLLSQRIPFSCFSRMKHLSY